MKKVLLFEVIGIESLFACYLFDLGVIQFAMTNNLSKYCKT